MGGVGSAARPLTCYPLRWSMSSPPQPSGKRKRATCLCVLRALSASVSLLRTLCSTSAALSVPPVARGPPLSFLARRSALSPWRHTDSHDGSSFGSVRPRYESPLIEKKSCTPLHAWVSLHDMMTVQECDASTKQYSANIRSSSLFFFRGACLSATWPSRQVRARGSLPLTRSPSSTLRAGRWYPSKALTRGRRP